jgi:hypothetical protein
LLLLLSWDARPRLLSRDGRAAGRQREQEGGGDEQGERTRFSAGHVEIS